MAGRLDDGVVSRAQLKGMLEAVLIVAEPRSFGERGNWRRSAAEA